LGGTKTILALFEIGDFEHLSLKIKFRKEFSSQNYSSFEEIAQEFLRANSIPRKSIVQATLGVAGPVMQGRSKLTNLKWELNEETLGEDLGIQKVKLINDLEGTANYIPFLKEDEMQTLYKGDDDDPHKRGKKGTSAIISLGTGLGEAYLTWDDDDRDGRKYYAHASEGGHCDFAPNSEIEDELLQNLRKKFEHVSYELVCSGKGIYNSWSYFHERYDSKSSSCSTLSKKVSGAEDPTRVIVDQVMKKGNACEACSKTLSTFVSILGAESGNLALRFIATGGVYIGGGLLRAILPALSSNENFLRMYLRKGRMSKLVSQIPIIAILTPDSNLLGAAHYTLDSLSSVQSQNIPRTENLIRT
jgi:glucokinase